MEKIVNELKDFTPETPTYEGLGKYVKQLKVEDFDYQSDIPPIDQSGSYSRNILCLEPLECVLLHWPPKVESAIHYHKGFWGYVMVLEGACDNVEYKMEGDKLIECQTVRAYPGGILDEPDGTIHKIANPSNTQTLITAHFYYPALETLDGLKVFDIPTQRIGVLNEKANSASFTEPESCFHSIEENAFEFVDYKTSRKVTTHRIFPIIPKPKPEQIREMIMQYYNEQSREYDDFDLTHSSRWSYIQKINSIISEELNAMDSVQNVLGIACGTGRRAVTIRQATKHDYHITCVDLSEEMCSQAIEHGFTTIAGDWLKVTVPDGLYDAATFLYAFGHVPSHKERLDSLKKIHQKLKDGGALYLDVFNAHDQNEWGPKAIEAYEKLNLSGYGYDYGDVFYKKMGGEAIAFLHYFTEKSLCNLLNEAGFEVEYCKHIGYVYKSGEELSGDDKGALFVKAVKIS